LVNATGVIGAPRTGGWRCAGVAWSRAALCDSRCDDVDACARNDAIVVAFAFAMVKGDSCGVRDA